MNRLISLTGTTLRILFASVWILTSLYALLAYVPFTYRQVLQIELVPAVQVFAYAQPVLIALITCAFALFILALEKRETISIEDSRELAAIALGSLFLAVWNLPARLSNDSVALVWSFVCLVPPLWLALMDFRAFPEIEAKLTRSPRVISAALIAALVSTIASIVTGANLNLTSLAAVLALGAGLGALLGLLEQFLRVVKISVRGAFVAYGVFLGLAFGSFVFGNVSASIAFFGPSAIAWSFAFAGTVAMTAAGLALKRMSTITFDGSEGRALSLFARGVLPPGPPIVAAISGLLLSIATLSMASKAFARMDWNGLGLNATSLALLALNILTVLVLVLREHRYERIARRFLEPLLWISLVGLATLTFVKRNELATRSRTDSLASTSVSILFPAKGRSSVFPFLQSRSGLAKTTKLVFPPLQLPPIPKDRAAKPFLFVFVIDSLRRDYLAPYNPDVAFTPEIGKFARESTVFKSAFTRYGATGLSEPSIWAGRMFPHMMYPQPFESMNLLHRLVVSENYPIWVSRDSILQEILPKSSMDRDLDEGVGTQDLDFCQTADEIRGRLEENATEPVFVYSQSQNIHVSVLARAEKTDANEFVGFHGPYAHALKRVDGCFGRFIEDLKRLGIYDKSVVVLTADHGDSLGEEGRFGHAYTIFPEIVQIPLLIHLPKSTHLKARRDIAFSTDIAPSIASLLGRPVPETNWSQGRSLFYDKTVAATPEGPHLVMSSYGPVAGVIANDLESIYIADAINFESHHYQFTERGSTNAGVTPQIASENDEIIQSKVDSLHSLFGL